MTASCTAREGEVACFEKEDYWKIALCEEPLGERSSVRLRIKRNLRRMSVAERIDGRDMGCYHMIEQDTETLRSPWMSYHENLT